MAPSSYSSRRYSAAEKEKAKSSPIARGEFSLYNDSLNRILLILGACLNCRRRKVKCDGKQPTCSPCAKIEGDWRKWPQRLGSTPQKCVYGPTGTQQPLLYPKTSSSQSQTSHTPDEGQVGGTSMRRNASSTSQTQPLSLSSLSPSRSFLAFDENQSSNQSGGRYSAGAGRSIFDLQSPSDYLLPSSSQRSRTISDQTHNRDPPEQLISPQPPHFSTLHPASLQTPSAAKGMREFSQGHIAFMSAFGLSNLPDPSSSEQFGPATIWELPTLGLHNLTAPYVPTYELLARITEQFFLHSPVASILDKEVFLTSLGSLATGRPLEKALLHAVLANSSAFINARDAEASLFDLEDQSSEIHSLGNRTIAAAHARRARDLVDPHRQVLADTEEAFVISLLLLSHEVTLEGGARAQVEAAWSSVAIRRLAFHDLPILPSAGEPSYLLPSTSLACTTLWQSQERRRRFWMFFSLDRGIQAMFAWAPFLAEEDVHSTLMLDDSVDRSTGTQTPRRLTDIDFSHLKATTGSSSYWSLFKASVIFSRIINYQIQLTRAERDGTSSTPLRETIQASQEYQKLALEAQLTEEDHFSSQPLGETELVDPVRFCASVTAWSSRIVLNELKVDYEVLNTSVQACLSAAQSIASSASTLESNHFNYGRCRFESVTAFWIAGKTLLRRLRSNNAENQERWKLRQDFLLILKALVKYGHFYSRGTFLAKSLLALHRNPWFPATPALWPPHALCHSLAKSSEASGFQYPNLSDLSFPISPADLGAKLSDEELHRVVHSGDI